MAGPASLPPHYSAFSICFLCILHLVFQPNCFASYCGESAIPFSFEVLPDGHLVLGCSRPNCFGWDAFGRPSANDSNFYRVNKQPDGFFRKALVSNTPKPLGDLESGWYRPQTANCTVGYKRGRCSSPAAADHDLWVGGIAPIFDSKTPLLLRCCRWHGLAQSADRGLAKVGAGQIVYGGEVLDGERQYAFDYVGDVVRVDGEIRPRYEVQIFRFACLPRPERLAADVDSGVIKEMLEKFTLALPPTESGQHFASPLAAADEGEKLSLETPKHRHNGQSNVIKTSKLSRLPAENNSEKQQQQETNNDYGEEEEEEEGDDKQHIQHLGIGRGKAFAAPIQGPFAENEVEPAASADPNLVGEQGPQQHQQIWPQLDRDIHDNVGQPAEVQKAAGGVTRRRIICDRNMTRARRQAECQEVGRRFGVQTKIHIGFLSFPVEIEAPPGTEIQVEDGAYYGPNAAGSGWYPGTWVGGGSQLSCFAADSRIRLANGQQRRMDQLAVGDWVVSANETALVYSIVESWIHRVTHQRNSSLIPSHFHVPNQIAEFVRLELADGRVLKLTGQHFIYRRSNCLQQGIQQKRRWPMLQVFERAELAFAEQVRAGDCLYVGPTETFAAVEPGLVEQPVVRVSIVRDRGIFAPMTSTGNLMVEGVLASCFAVEPNPTLQRSLSWTQMHTQFYQSLGERLEMELPGWLLFVVDHLMPFVVPK